MEVYTDGACKGNPGVGGWGVYIINGDDSFELFGGEEYTTNNKMELIAVIKALQFVKDKYKNEEVEINTDSKYVKNGIESWIKKWKQNGWRTVNKKPVKNIELWQELDDLVSFCTNISWKWVRGHCGNIGNEKADELANKGVMSICK